MVLLYLGFLGYLVLPGSNQKQSQSRAAAGHSPPAADPVVLSIHKHALKTSNQDAEGHDVLNEALLAHHNNENSGLE